MNRARAPTGDGFGGPTSGGVDPIPRGSPSMSAGARRARPASQIIEKEMEMSGRIIDLTATLTTNMPAHKSFQNLSLCLISGTKSFANGISESLAINWSRRR